VVDAEVNVILSKVDGMGSSLCMYPQAPTCWMQRLSTDIIAVLAAFYRDLLLIVSACNYGAAIALRRRYGIHSWRKLPFALRLGAEGLCRSARLYEAIGSGQRTAFVWHSMYVRPEGSAEVS
jgi:hypothetical protein